MKNFIACLILLTLAGCTTTRNADQRAREAYVQGQQQAMTQAQEAKTPLVYIQGNVKNAKIPWTEDLTLAKAIVAAEYQGMTTPRMVRLVRNQQPTDIKVADLLKGNDVPVMAGDIIVISY